MMKNILAIIPARAGSKGIKDKNIQRLADKPLMVWTFEEVKKSKLTERIILNTDSPKYAQIGKKYGLEVPFLRPNSLAKDDTPILEVLKHNLKYLYQAENYLPEALVLLQPTAPFRKPGQIDEAIRLYFKKKKATVVSVSKIPGHFNPDWQLKINQKGFLELTKGSHLSELKIRKQDLKQTYFRNGQIYVFNPNDLIYLNNLYGKKVIPIITNGKINIDSPEDFEYAEYLIKTKKI